MPQLIDLIAEYLEERGHIIEYSPHQMGISFRIRINQDCGPDDEDEYLHEKGTVGMKVGKTHVTYCHLTLDFHDPDSFKQLENCIEVCRKAKICDECPIKRLWLLWDKGSIATRHGKVSVEHP